MFDYFKKIFLISLFLGMLPSVYGMDSDSKGNNRCNDQNLNRKILSLLADDYYRQNHTHFSLKRVVRVPTPSIRQQNFGNNPEIDNPQKSDTLLATNPISATKIVGYTIFNPHQSQEKNCTIQ